MLTDGLLTQVSQKVLKRGECQERILNGKSYLLVKQKSNEKKARENSQIVSTPFSFLEENENLKPVPRVGQNVVYIADWNIPPDAVKCNGVHFDWPAHDSDWCAIPLFSPACASWDQVVEGKAVFSSRQSFLNSARGSRFEPKA